MLEDHLNKSFSLPIDFCSNTYDTPKNLFEDLELIETHKDVSNVSLYEHLLNPQTPFGFLTLEKWSKKYTTNTAFLKDTQKMLLNNKPIDDKNLNTISNAWKSYKGIKEDSGFIDNYQYINWKPLQFLNTSIIFLTIISIYSILSPLLNLLAPILLLVVPFLIMKLKGLTVSFQNYIVLLIASLKRHSFGKLLTDWSTIPTGQKMYLMVMLGMYVYNIYQNAISCYQFYKNTSTINGDIKNIKNLLGFTRERVGQHIVKIDKLKTYEPYRNYLQEKLENINNLYNSLNKVPIASFNPQKIPYIGYTMKEYYKLYNDENIQDTILFSFGFHGYLDNIGEISNKIRSNGINKMKFLKKENAVLKFKEAHYPVMQQQKSESKNIPNDIDLKTNKLITGPNASGKTSLLKTTITNILLSQQFGYGFFKKGSMTPFDHIHCYLNIPDTSSRDSLFQAEARRCLEILTKIKNNEDKKHFCIFDELFSGTNPYEAISSAKSYLTHISKSKNIKFLLTTHFITLCKQLDDNSQISNVNMKTYIKNEIPIYYYKLQNGISEIKGGITVLKQLGYPQNIIDETNKAMDNF
jgi:DNA mismatch repair ATPase MutS